MRVDLSGNRYGRLLVTEFTRVAVSPCGSKNSVWRCLCDCGKFIDVLAVSLKSGNTASCGCYKLESITKHSLCDSATYKSWSGMKSRCLNPKTPLYYRYGGRGIKVCDRWLDFNNFLADMGERPHGASLDRINNNGDYEPSNCRWATRKEQANNTSSNNRITFNGVTKNLHEWASALRISTASLHKRLKNWPLEQALTIQKGFRK